MDVRSHPQRARARFRDVFPPVQISTTGQPISIVDAVVSAILLAVALFVIERMVGREID